MIPGKKYTPNVILHLLWKHRWLVVLPFVALTTGTVLYSARLPNRYRSETLITVVPQRVPESYVRATITEKIEDRLPAIREQILSRTQLERIIRDFNLYSEARRRTVMEDVVARMRLDIDVEIVSKSDSFRVGYEASDPDVAMKVTDRLAALFIEENLRDRELLAAGTSAFLESQLQDARRRLTEQEQKIEAYRRQYGGELPSQLQFNLQAMQAAQNQLQLVAEAINRDRDRRLLLERTIEDLSTIQPPVPTPSERPTEAVNQNDPLAVQLEAARNALKALELRLKPEHPDVVRMRRTVENLEKQAKAAESSAPSEGSPRAPAPQTPAAASDLARLERIKELRAEIESLDRQVAFREAEQARLQKTIQMYQARVEAVPARESDLASLTRDYDTLQTLYKSLLTKREDSKLAENLERRQVGEQFKVLDPARRSERPSSPDRLRINLIGAAAGLFAGLGLLSLVEYRDVTFHDERDVASALSLPVVALIPPILTPHERRRALVANLLFSAAASLVVVSCAVVVVMVLRHQ